MIDFADRARRALAMRKAGMTLNQIGEELKLSRERVRQIVWRAAMVERGELDLPQWDLCRDKWHEHYEWTRS